MAEEVQLIQKKVESIQDLLTTQNFFPPNMAYENIEPVIGVDNLENEANYDDEEEYQLEDPNPYKTLQELKWLKASNPVAVKSLHTSNGKVWMGPNATNFGSAMRTPTLKGLEGGTTQWDSFSLTMHSYVINNDAILRNYIIINPFIVSLVTH